MSHPMFLLTVSSEGVELEVRLNDVRQYRKHHGAPAEFSARLNPWLLSGTNALTVTARPAGSAAGLGGGGTPATAAPDAMVSLRVIRAVQGQPSDGAPVLFQFDAGPGQLSALAAGATATLASASFDAGVLPWGNRWQPLPAASFARAEVMSFLRDYMAAIARADLQAVADANRLRTAILADSLGMDPGAVAASLGRRLSGMDPGGWQLIDERQIVLGAEGGGRFCRVESASGGPVIVLHAAGQGAGFALLLAKASGRLWIAG